MPIKRRYVLLSLFILLFFLGCENYHDEYLIVLEENETLEYKIDELEANVEELQTEVEEKTEQIEDLESENEVLKNVIEEAGIEY